MTNVPLPVFSSRDQELGPDLHAWSRELAALIEGEVRFGAHDRMLYATDASIYQRQPLGVVIPRSLQDVERTIAWCHDREVPILPRGGGTSLAGQTVNRAIVIDVGAFLRDISWIDAPRRLVRVQPGVVLDQLNRALAPHGLRFGPDVATSTHATIGGMIGNNSAGANSVLYGRTVEHVVAIEAILADGRRVTLDEGAGERDEIVRDLTQRVVNVIDGVAEAIDRRFPKTKRRVDGYNLDLILAQRRASTHGTLDRVNLAHLLCGSEGTLAFTAEAMVRAVPLPRARGLAIISFASIDAALDSVVEILATAPAAVELVDDVIIRLAEENLEYRKYVDLLPRAPQAEGAGVPAAVLYVEYYRDSVEEVELAIDALAKRFGAATMNRYLAPEAIAGAWKLRKAGEPLLHGLPGERKPVTFIEDTAVDPSRLAAFIREFRRIVTQHGTTASYYAHASVGCLHVRPLVCIRDPRDFEVMQSIMREVTELVVSMGGALSGEHGDGRLRSHQLEQFFGPEICRALRDVKAIFDPGGRMNPGIIIDPDPMTAHLRIGSPSHPHDVPPGRTFYRYEREHGFGEAVDRCNGAGVCRKLVGGTMCPSYRATLDERHSTRGRGNALRLAITGQFPAGEHGAGAERWRDEETLRTLDLCLSCKACRSECPSNVDIAKLKSEYLAQGYAVSGGAPLAVRAIGAVRRLNALGGRAPRLVSAVMNARIVRWMMERVAGIDRRRSLPPIHAPLTRWMARRERVGSPQGAPAVILFADCFTNWNEPDVGRSAVRVLEALGYRVVLADVGCCGRAAISNGLLAEAAPMIRRTAQRLDALVRQSGAESIVVCEPSCASAMTEDWVDLETGLDAGFMKVLAARVHLAEDFIEKRWESHPRRPAFRPAAQRRVVVHGHCHQKALWGAESTLRLLRRAYGDRVELLDTGCCGMAGAFGMTKDHYELSQKIGELALFPALRAAPDALVAACGTSCRHQVHDALSRQAHHPVELLAMAMEE